MGSDVKNLLHALNAVFRRFGYELVKQDADIMRLSADVLLVSAAAEPLVRKLDGVEGVSPEYRRHAVYAELLKRFPDIPAMAVSIAIEHALSKWRVKLAKLELVADAK